MRLDRFVAGCAEVGSRSGAERLIEAGLVLVDGAPRPKSHRLGAGSVVSLPEPEPPPAAEPPAGIGVPIAYSDPYLVVVDKPAGLLVHPVPGHAGPTLVDALRGVAAGGDEARPGIVHRLDRDTSGLLLVARDGRTHARLQAQLRRRRIGRTYTALVRGRPRSRRGRIEAPIGRDRHDPTRVSLDTDTPRDAVTHFELDRLLAGHALLRVRLETGRMHQIRVHLAAIDLPVVGDPVYGVAEPSLGRQFLHAGALAFDHPFTGDRASFDAPLPAELERFLATIPPT
jgi:23S rRNA pseudouridine1911/1915/1917 synthase